MRTVIFIFVCVFGVPLWAWKGSSDQPKKEPLLHGEKLVLHSNFLKEDRSCWVYLPADYHQRVKSYPVIVTLDAEILFYPVTGLVNHLSGAARMPEAIVIGLPSGRTRLRDYNPPYKRDLYPHLPPSRIEQYASFLEKELLPHIDANYRTHPFRILMGRSPAGGFALWSFVNQPRLFQAHIIMGTGLEMVHASGETTLQMMENSLKKQSHHQGWLYLGLGAYEVDSQPSLAQLGTILKQKAPKKLKWKTEILDGEDHFSLNLKAALHGLELIFPSEKWYVPWFDIFEKHGFAGIRGVYGDLSATYGFPIIPAADRFWAPETLATIGYAALRNGDARESIGIFEYMVKHYPNLPNAYDCLADAYEAAGQLDKALMVQKKAVDLAEKYSDRNKALFEKHLHRLEMKLSKKEG